jgi:hypothetical protein
MRGYLWAYTYTSVFQHLFVCTHTLSLSMSLSLSLTHTHTHSLFFFTYTHRTNFPPPQAPPAAMNRQILCMFMCVPVYLCVHTHTHTQDNDTPPRAPLAAMNRQMAFPRDTPRREYTSARERTLRLCMYVCVYIHIYTHIHTHMQMRCQETLLDVSTRPHAHVRGDCVCVCMHVFCVYIYIYIYTHTHTHKRHTYGVCQRHSST